MCLTFQTSASTWAELIAGSSENRNDLTINPVPNTVLLDAEFFDLGVIATMEDDNAILYHGVGDFDADGNPDIAISGWTFKWPYPEFPERSNFVLFEADIDSTQLLSSINLTGTETSSGTAFLRFVDIENDGDQDLLVLSHNEAPFVPLESKLYRNKGDNFVSEDIFPKMAVHEASLGDFNGDGFVDIFAGAYQSDISFEAYKDQLGEVRDGSSNVLLLNDGTGKFQAWPLMANMAIETLDGRVNDAGGKPILRGSATAIADLDQDGTSELVIVDSWGGSHPDNLENYVLTNIQF